jgi:hypothetical protein
MGESSAAEKLTQEELEGPQSETRPVTQPEANTQSSTAEKPANENDAGATVPANFIDMTTEQKAELIKGRVDAGEAKAVTDAFREWAENPENIQMGIDAVSRLDRLAPIRWFRNFWNNRSAEVQWAIMKTTSVLSTGPVAPAALWYNVGPIQSLIKMGVITYKGHIGEDGQVMEDKITAMGGIEKVMLNGGLKVASAIASVGKAVYPELAIVELAEKFTGPAKDIFSSSGPYMEKVRAGVYENRAAFQTAQVERKAITNETRYQLRNVLAVA